MGVSSYFEFVVTLFGWVMYDNLWSVLGDSGIIYIPFLVIFLKNIMETRRAGDDEGNAAIQSLKKSETDIIVALFVFLLAVVPVITVNLSEMSYVKPALDCQVPSETVTGDNTGTSYDRTLQTFGGQTGRMPVWWSFVHIVTKSITSASIASIPCSYDLASVETRLANERIESPQLRKEIQEFINDCYMPSKAAFYRDNTGGLSSIELDSTNWIGSDYFINSTNYYKKYYSTKPRDGWAFDATRDAGFEDDGPLGHPTCQEWWNDSTNGIRAKVMSSLDTNLMNDLANGSDSLIENTVGLTNETDRQNLVLRDYFAIQNSNANISGFRNNLATSYSVGVGDKLDGILGDTSWTDKALNALSISSTMSSDIGTTVVAGIGGIISAPSHLASSEMIKEGSSIFQGIILMMFIILLIFLQILALYQIRYIMVLTVIFFAINYMSFIWGIAFWVDNQLMNTLLTGDGVVGAFVTMSNPTQALVLVWIQKIMYVVLPGLFLAGMGWVGFKAGGLGDGLKNMSGSAEQPGNSGGNAVTSVAMGKIR